MCKEDVALLLLQDEIPTTEAKPATPDLNTDDVGLSVARKFAALGYGSTDWRFDLEAGTEHHDWGNATRRVRTNISTRCVSNTDGVCSLFDQTLPPPHTMPLPAESMVIGRSIMLGDSGGGVYDQASYVAGDPKLVGVAYWVDLNGKGIIENAAMIRVSKHRNWIIAAARTAAREAGTVVPAWARTPGQ
jgi:hypothetical protein